MSNEKSVFDRFISELRNRRVFRVATVYLGVGFALLEAFDILVPKLGLPGVTVLVVGFPIAVILAWHYQFTPDGIRKSPKSGEKQTVAEKPLTSNRIIIALLVFIALMLVYPKIITTDSQSLTSELMPEKVDPKSIAVLPFTSFTDEREDEIFADGMHDDILTQLSKIHALRVVSRTTMMKYKDTEKSIKDIADEVGVANLLEGSVRRAGEQVRIVAQLINARTDEHLWAETYDRNYADIFAVQSDVARKIASALKSALTPEEKAQLDEVPTSNMKAYDFFLKGNHFWYTKTTKEGNLQAVAMYGEAIKLDPGFGLAHARQSIAHAVLYEIRAWDPTPERKQLAQKALDNALQSFEKAFEGQPNNSEISNHLGQLYGELGDWDRALVHLERAFQLAPADLGNAGWLAGVHHTLGNFDLAEKYYRLTIKYHPEQSVGYRFYAKLKRNAFGDLDASRQILQEGVMSTGRPDLLASSQFWTEVASRNFKEAIQIIDNHYLGESKFYYMAIGHYLQKDQEQLVIATQKAQAEIEEALVITPNSPELHRRLAIVLAFAGADTEALIHANKAIELMSVTDNALDGPDNVYTRAMVYSLLGKADLALDDLEFLLSFTSGIFRGDFHLNPLLEPLHNSIRYQKMMRVTS
jgi:TolB-like protein/Flp pilus assembly protein TadD